MKRRERMIVGGCGMLVWLAWTVPAAAQIAVSANDNKAVLVDGVNTVVRNPAPDLTPSAVASLGDRHVRSHTGRDRSLHAGIGLALSGALARQLELVLSLELVDGEFRATLGKLKPLES